MGDRGTEKRIKFRDVDKVSLIFGLTTSYLTNCEVLDENVGVILKHIEEKYHSKASKFQIRMRTIDMSVLLSNPRAELISDYIEKKFKRNSQERNPSKDAGNAEICL